MTKEVSYLDDGDVCVLTKDKIEFFDKNRKKIEKKIHKLVNEEGIYNKGSFKDFMSKEISEQPEIIKKCVNEYLDKLRKKLI
jgi:glucosamine--fructose-6-phosphate aminotransferase (isomerizing)